jgi:glucokinase
MEKQNIIVGVDIGGTNTAFGFLNIENQFLYEDSFLTEPVYGAEKFAQKLAKYISDAFRKYSDQYNLCGISMAAPSANFLNGSIESSANLQWKEVKLVNIMKKYFDTPIIILNDGDAAAIGEYVNGSAKGMKNFLVLTLGTGVGSGIIVNGELLSGEHGHAGELGHIIIKPKGRKCKCGRYGCLETYISANGIRRTAVSLLGYYDFKSQLRNISYNDLTSLYISELAEAGDPIALKTFEYTGKILGRALANVVTYFDPEAIILFGGLAEAGDLLLKPTINYFEKSLLNLYKGKVKILKSELQNGKAAILGACSFLKWEMAKKTAEFKFIDQ